MKSPRRLLVCAAWLVAASLARVAPVEAQAHEPWVVVDGRVVIHFHESVLADLGLAVVNVEQTAEVLEPLSLESMDGPLVAFALADTSDLRVLRSSDGGFVPYGVLGGTAQVDGRFTLASPRSGSQVDFADFRIHPLPVENDGPGGALDPDYFYMSPGRDPFGTDFNLCYVKIFSGPKSGYGPGDHDSPGDHDNPVVTIKSWDMAVTDTLAAKLGRPELAGAFLGLGKLEARIVPWTGAWSYPRGQNPFTPFNGVGAPSGDGSGGLSGLRRDVKLGGLSSIVNMGHVGTFGEGRTALSMATTSCNVGSSNVEWLSPDLVLNEDHPGIAMQLYREWNGRFEHVGRSWIKHGFFALMNSQCTPCQGGTIFGTFLGVGCSDTYGTGNNADRFWLGPRAEWDPWAGTWECEGSYFDGTPSDCVRDENGCCQGAVNHRLEAFDSELGTPDAKYYYEAMYLVRDDDDLWNNIGSRECTVETQGNSFVFDTPAVDNPLVQGPAVMRWGDMQTVAGLEPDDGNAVLAVDVTPLGGGQWRYEYALMNWTLDRKLRSFSVPTCGDASDFFFKDIDLLAGNDWQVTVEGGMATWEFTDVVVTPGPSKQAGALMYGTLYNFGFTSSVRPDVRDAVLGVHEAGPGGDLILASTLVPGECLNLSADSAAPEPDGTVTLELRRGSDHAVLALIEAGGVPVVGQPLFPDPPPAFVDGAVDVTLFVPAFATGLDFVLVAGDVSVAPLTTLELSNTLRLVVQ